MKITEDIRYIGVNDTKIDLFESQFPVPEGIAYNSYVILDEKVAVMDTVDLSMHEEWEARLLSALDGRKVDFLVVQHLEPDHTGSISRLTELFPEMILVGNAKTFQMLPQYFDFSLEKRMLVVKEGDELCLGKHTLTFLMAPMVHWPEVMVTYDRRDKILFSADAFGKFGAVEEASLRETQQQWVDEAARYYFNIVGKYGGPVQTLLKKVSALDIEKICPLHGPILDDNLAFYLHLYDVWSSYQPEQEGVLIAYASIYGNTAKAAKRAAELLNEQGIRTVLFDLARDDMSETLSWAFRYDRMLLAASSYEGEVFPCMQNFLLHLKNKAYQNRRVALIENGSWGPTASRTMKNLLETMKDLTICEPAVTIRGTLKTEDDEALKKMTAFLA